MSIRFEKAFRTGLEPVRARLRSRERQLFDFICAAGQLGYRLPDDKIDLAAVAGGKDPRLRLAAEFSHLLRSRAAATRWSEAGTRLAAVLLAELKAESMSEERRALRILLAYVTIALAPDLVIPEEPIARAAWDTVVTLFAKLFPSEISALGALDCVQKRLPQLQREIAAGLKIGRIASGQRPGPDGRNLAVDPKLIALVGSALGKEMATGYMARYLYYAKAGDHIWPHPDDPQYAVTLLICILHELPPDVAARSAFVAYRPDGSAQRYELRPGEALALEPGLIHAREPVRRGERVALLSIGLHRA